MTHGDKLFSPADIAIDLGTANTLVVKPGSGIVFDQPSVCCFKAYDAVPEFVAAGAEASRFIGRTSKPLKIVWPLRNGVLSDMASARELLRFATGGHRRSWRLGRPRAIIGTPAEATEAERKALTTAALDAGLAEPRLVDEPLLAAIGLGWDVDEPRGRMIVDCGAGTTEVAVISLGRICVSHSVRGGGDALDQALIDHLHLKHRFDIGIATAEQLKLDLVASLERGDTGRQIEVRGLDVTLGVPATITPSAGELSIIWDKHAEAVAGAVRAALHDTHPELCQDIFDDGITLTGGASTSLLADKISEATGVAARVAESPSRSVASGLERILEQRR